MHTPVAYDYAYTQYAVHHTYMSSALLTSESQATKYISCSVLLLQNHSCSLSVFPTLCMPLLTFTVPSPSRPFCYISSVPCLDTPVMRDDSPADHHLLDVGMVYILPSAGKQQGWLVVPPVLGGGAAYWLPGDGWHGLWAICQLSHGKCQRLVISTHIIPIFKYKQYIQAFIIYTACYNNQYMYNACDNALV